MSPLLQSQLHCQRFPVTDHSWSGLETGVEKTPHMGAIFDHGQSVGREHHPPHCQTHQPLTKNCREESGCTRMGLSISSICFRGPPERNCRRCESGQRSSNSTVVPDKMAIKVGEIIEPFQQLPGAGLGPTHISRLLRTVCYPEASGVPGGHEGDVRSKHCSTTLGKLQERWSVRKALPGIRSSPVV